MSTATTSRTPDLAAASASSPVPVTAALYVAPVAASHPWVMAMVTQTSITRPHGVDVRLEGTLVRALGTFLSERGMDVTPDGTWSFTGEVGNPFIGDGLDEGNRQIHFGVDPFDPGLGGPQPSRLVHDGLISIP